MADEDLDKLVRDIRADEKCIRLFGILGHQLELFVTGGRPDLNCLLTSLKSEALVSEDEYGKLKSTFALDMVIPPKSREIAGRFQLNASDVGVDAEGNFGYRHRFLDRGRSQQGPRGRGCG